MTPSSSPSVQDRSSEALAALREHLGREFASDTLDRLVFLPPSATPDDLSAALGSPSRAVLENTVPAASMGKRLARVLEGGGLFAGISAQMAMTADLGDRFFRALARHTGLSGPAGDDMALALQEALANAVTHGSLELSAFSRETPEEFLAYSLAMEERLADPAYGGRAVEVWALWSEAAIELSVRDHGPGYRPLDVAHGAAPDGSGRGLVLIAEAADTVTFSEDRRRITMAFRRPPPPEGVLEPPLIHGRTQPIDFSRSRVLIVEDQFPNRQVLSAYLESMGVSQIEMAVNGCAGLECVERASPDLIILDIMMPEMDGFEMLAHLRADPRWRDLPVLVQTALGEPAERVEIFNAGATDLVTKPINGPEFCARVRIQLENQALIRSLQESQAHLRRDLLLAAETQAALMPTAEDRRTAEARYGIQLQAHTEASSELGGDMWDLSPIDDRRLAVSIADFSGHGVNAALNTMRLHTLMNHQPPGRLSPAAYLANLNEQLATLLPVDQFATMFLGILDLETSRLDFALAGGPGPIIATGRETEAAQIPADSLPLGVRRGTVYRDRSVALLPGGVLFLFSDALSESRGHDGRPLDDAGVVALVQNVRVGRRGAANLSDIIDRFFARTPRPLEDDLTAVWLARNPEPNHSGK